MSIDIETIKQITESYERTRPLCPDHRDKQNGSVCLACRIEALQNALLRIEAHTVRELPKHQADPRNRLQAVMALAYEALERDRELMKGGGR